MYWLMAVNSSASSWFNTCNIFALLFISSLRVVDIGHRERSTSHGKILLPVSRPPTSVVACAFFQYIHLSSRMSSRLKQYGLSLSQLAGGDRYPPSSPARVTGLRRRGMTKALHAYGWCR